jgi:hypothetical protein
MGEADEAMFAAELYRLFKEEPAEFVQGDPFAS